LVANDIEFDGLIMSKDKATEINRLQERFNVVMFADDRASTVRSVNNNCDVKYPILVNRAHNERYKSLSQKDYKSR